MFGEREFGQTLPHPGIFHRKLREVVIPDLEGPRFIYSWRGTFATTGFSDEDRKRVVGRLKALSASRSAG